MRNPAKRGRRPFFLWQNGRASPVAAILVCSSPLGDKFNNTLKLKSYQSILQRTWDAFWALKSHAELIDFCATLLWALKFALYLIMVGPGTQRNKVFCMHALSSLSCWLLACIYWHPAGHVHSSTELTLIVPKVDSYKSVYTFIDHLHSLTSPLLLLPSLLQPHKAGRRAGRSAREKHHDKKGGSFLANICTWIIS